MKPSGPELSLVGRFLSWIQCHYLWLPCSYYLFLPGSVLEACTFIRIFPFLPGCPFYWHIVADSSLLQSFCISVISPFSFLILLIWFFSLFFFMSLSNDLSILFIFSKKPVFSFVDFGYDLLCFFCIYFCPNFYDFFPTNPGVLHFFLF